MSENTGHGLLPGYMADFEQIVLIVTHDKARSLLESISNQTVRTRKGWTTKAPPITRQTAGMRPGASAPHHTMADAAAMHATVIENAEKSREQNKAYQDAWPALPCLLEAFGLIEARDSAGAPSDAADALFFTTGLGEAALSRRPHWTHGLLTTLEWGYWGPGRGGAWEMRDSSRTAPSDWNLALLTSYRILRDLYVAPSGWFDSDTVDAVHNRPGHSLDDHGGMFGFGLTKSRSTLQYGFQRRKTRRGRQLSSMFARTWPHNLFATAERFDRGADGFVGRSWARVRDGMTFRLARARL